MHVKVGSPRASFAGAIREEGESDAEEYFGTEGTDDSKFSIESLVALPIAPGAKWCKNASALLGAGPLESFLVYKLTKEALEGYRSIA